MYPSNAFMHACSHRRNKRHLVWAIISIALAIIVLLYMLKYVVFPSRQFVKAKQKECLIRKAKLSCWRRKLLSAAHIEQGRYTCWLFTVKVGNSTHTVQYNTLRDFPKANDGCSSASACGMELWPCLVNEVNQVRLRWRYPVNQVVYCAMSIVATILFGAISVWWYVRVKEDGCESEQGSSMSVPFRENPMHLSPPDELVRFENTSLDSGV